MIYLVAASIVTRSASSKCVRAPETMPNHDDALMGEGDLVQHPQFPGITVYTTSVTTKFQ